LSLSLRLPPKLLFVSILVALATLAGCQGPASDPIRDPAHDRADSRDPSEVIKSPNDDRRYRYLELDNKLRVLLVSDADTDKAAASLVVFRGSYHEPDAYPGLAHFLEHMLFIGTAKYPEVDAYQQFISQHGGSSNAYTASDHTNYFFDIQPAYFAEAMDRFAQFFVAPLLAEDYVEREKNAVHSEYQMQIRADNWRGNAVLATALNPGHPRARFNIGSLETLGDGVQEALESFFENHYSADQMALVALSSESLDDMERWIRPMFGAVPNRDLGPAPTTAPLFKPNQLPAVLSHQTIMDGYRVSYGFPVPATEPHYREKPADYLTNLLGHEGHGSLHQALLRRGWLESLSAGSWSVDDRNGLIVVDIALTPDGYRNVDRVTDLLFGYIERLQQSPPEAWRYAEQARVAELGFRFQEKTSATGFVYQVAPRLMKYPPRDLLVAPYLMTSFDAGLIRDYARLLTPENVLMTLAGPDVETNARERWFDVPYRLEQRAPDRHATPAGELALPQPNPYLPENLEILADHPGPPVRVVDRPGLTLWQDRDTAFRTPRANLYLSLGIPDGIGSATDLAFAELYRALVEDALGAEIYPAYLAGLNYNLAVDAYGLELRISGYSDKQVVLLAAVLETLTELEIDAARFAVIRDRLLREWQNYREERPYSQAVGAMSYLLLSHRWPPEALIDALQHRTPAELAHWRTTRLTRFNIEGLRNGNVDDSDIPALTTTLARSLPLATIDRTPPSVTTVTSALRYPIVVDHEDAAIVIYLQDAESSFVSRARTALAAGIMRQAYFTSLRTEQQLGYVVSLSNQTLRDRGGLAFIVQSPVASTAVLEDLTRTFLAQQLDAVAALSDDEFGRYQQGLIARLTERDRNLGERGRRLWGELELGETSFDTRERIAAEVAALTRSNVVDYVRSAAADFEQRRLMIYSPGRFAEVPTGGAVISDVTVFKQGR